MDSRSASARRHAQVGRLSTAARRGIKLGLRNKSTSSKPAIRSTLGRRIDGVAPPPSILSQELAKVKIKTRTRSAAGDRRCCRTAKTPRAWSASRKLLELAKRSETAIFTIGLQAARAERVAGIPRSEFVLRQLAQETGGRAYFREADRRLEGSLRPESPTTLEPDSMGYAPRNPRPRRRRSGNRRGRSRGPNSSARHEARYYGPVSLIGAWVLGPGLGSWVLVLGLGLWSWVLKSLQVPIPSPGPNPRSPRSHPPGPKSPSQTL